MLKDFVNKTPALKGGSDMKKVRLAILTVFIFLFAASLAKAVPVSLSGTAYWDLQVSVGSGTGIGAGIIADDGDTHLPPDPPAGISLPDVQVFEVSSDIDDDSSDDVYAFAVYDAGINLIEAYVVGFAYDPATSTTDTEWFSALSRVTVMSETFTGFNAFSISFDWEFDVDFGGGEGDAKIAFGLVDYTDPDDPAVVYYEIWEYDPLGDISGTYSWSIDTLDPTHVYLFGIGARAFLEGVENADGYVDVYIYNIDAQATPEPTSVLLAGAGLVALGIWGRRKSK